MSLVVCMTEADELDEGTFDLINQLCTRAGMVMEDAAPLALHRSASALQLESRLIQLHANVTLMASLIDAARTLANV